MTRVDARLDVMQEVYESPLGSFTLDEFLNYEYHKPKLNPTMGMTLKRITDTVWEHDDVIFHADDIYRLIYSDHDYSKAEAEAIFHRLIHAGRFYVIVLFFPDGSFELIAANDRRTLYYYLLRMFHHYCDKRKDDINYWAVHLSYSSVLRHQATFLLCPSRFLMAGKYEESGKSVV